MATFDEDRGELYLTDAEELELEEALGRAAYIDALELVHNSPEALADAELALQADGLPEAIAAFLARRELDG